MCVSTTPKGKTKMSQSTFLRPSWKLVFFPYVGHINKALRSFQMRLSCLFQWITGHAREQPMQIPRKKNVSGGNSVSHCFPNILFRHSFRILG